MLAARAIEGEKVPHLEEVEVPTISAEEVLVRVESTGLAPGLLALLERGFVKLLPSTLGQEIAGTVAELGEAIDDVAVGDRVRVHPNLTCRRCEFCLGDREHMCSSFSAIGYAAFGPDAMPLYERYHNGGLAGFVRVPRWALEPLPAEVSYDVGAKLGELAIAVRALRLLDLPPGGSLVVTAATGTMGAVTIRLAAALGAGRVIAVGRSAERLAAARELAPDLVETIALEDLDGWAERGLLSAAIRERLPGGADAVVDYFPEGPGTWQAIMALGMGGRAAIVGGNPTPPSLPTVLLMINCWTVLGTRGYTRRDAHEAMELVRLGRVRLDDLISHEFSLREVDQALEIVRTRASSARMIVVHPEHDLPE